MKQFKRDMIWFGMIILSAFIMMMTVLVIIAINIEDLASMCILLCFAGFFILPSLYMTTEVVRVWREYKLESEE